VETLAPLLGLIATGYAAGRARLLPPAAVRGLTTLAACIEIPALLFRTLAARTGGGPGTATALAYLAACLLVLGIGLALGRSWLGLSRAEAGVFALGCAYSNTSFLGVPLVQATYGPEGVSVLAQVVAVHSLVLLPALTLAVAAFAPGGARPTPASVARAALNPMVVAMAGGAAWSTLGHALPGVLDAFLASLSAAASPTALVAVGATVATLPRSTGASGPLAATAVKLVAHPLLTWCAATALGLPPLAVGVATLAAALPPGVNVFLLAERFGCYAAPSARALALSTLASAGTLAATLAIIA